MTVDDRILELRKQAKNPIKPAEEWKPIEGYNRLFEISDHGRFRASHEGAVIYNKMRFFKKFEKLEGYVPISPVPVSPSSLYPDILVPYGNTGSASFYAAHREVAKAFLGPIQKGFDVNHIDGYPGNNNLSNLEVITRSENILHGYRMKTIHFPIVPKRANAVINELKSIIDNGISKDIVKSYEAGSSPLYIAGLYGLHTWTVCQILRIKPEKSWKLKPFDSACVCKL